MISYLGSLVQFSPATGRAGRCRQISCVWGALTVFRPHWVCPAQGCLCFPRLPCSGSRLLYMEPALCLGRLQFLGPPQKRGFTCTCVLCLPRPERFREPEAWAPSPRARRAFSLRRAALSLRGERPRQPEAWVPSPRTRSAFSLRGPSARRRLASLGLSLPLSPPHCLLPPVGMGRPFSGVSQSLCFAKHRQ